MSATLRKSRTEPDKAFGHALFEEMYGTGGSGWPAIPAIWGYRPGDAGRERLPAGYSRPGTRPVTLAGSCGSVPEGVDRDSVLLPCQLDPAHPDGCGEPGGSRGVRGISPAVEEPALMVCW